MIFVTVGTHEQPFDRLLKCIDKMVEDGQIKEEVIVQKGYTDYEMKNCKSSKLIPYEEMQSNIKNARIVVTHGGPASFLDPLKYGKIPVVIPRKKEYNEHVNNHQVEFSKEVERRMKNIIVVETDEEIKEAILNYEKKIKKLNSKNNSNNKLFCEKLEQEIESIL